jgi:hypothetical protein
MNEHDSERIAGLLEADGLLPVGGAADAEVVVLNTCAIRENADNKLYGNLGQLKSWKDTGADSGDGRERQIVVAGCLAQKDGEIVRRRAPQVDVVLGTHNVHRSALLIDQARRGGPITEILAEAVADDHERFPSALPARRESGWSAWVTIQIGCDNSCAFCIVPSVRGREISRPFDDVAAEVAELAERGVTEVTLLGQNVNSYGRDLTLAARQQDGKAVRVVVSPVGDRLESADVACLHEGVQRWAGIVEHDDLAAADDSLARGRRWLRHRGGFHGERSRSADPFGCRRGGCRRTRGRFQGLQLEVPLLDRALELLRERSPSRAFGLEALQVAF